MTADPHIPKLDDLEVSGRRVLVRVDLNVPMADGRVTDDTRLRATLPTVTELADKGAIVLLLAHFGRPKGEPRDDMSLATRARPRFESIFRWIIDSTSPKSVVTFMSNDSEICAISASAELIFSSAWYCWIFSRTLTMSLFAFWILSRLFW